MPLGGAAVGVETPAPTPTRASATTSPTTTPGPGTERPGRSGEVPKDPLEVVIERLTPSTLPRPAVRSRVGGTITNRRTTRGRDLGVYFLTSVDPITTEQELRTAVASDPRTDIGDRIVEPGTFTDVPDLEPGDRGTRSGLGCRSRRSTSPARRGLLGRRPRAGHEPDGRLDGADGRARTFMPLVPERNDGTELALGMQFRNHTVRASDGTLRVPRGVAGAFAEDGRLRRLLDLSATAPRDRHRPGSSTRLSSTPPPR